MCYIERMKRESIAVGVALVVIFGFLLLSSPEKLGLASLHSPFSFSIEPVASLANSFTTISAWSVFQDYLAAAHQHDLVTIKRLSYQLSETCTNPQTLEACNALMDGVYSIASSFRQSDFTQVAFDDRQIVMATDYLGASESVEGQKTALFFIKGEQGEPRILSIKFCFGKEDSIEPCVNFDPNTRDQDGNGWWDEVESYFHNK